MAVAVGQYYLDGNTFSLMQIVYGDQTAVGAPAWWLRDLANDSVFHVAEADFVTLGFSQMFMVFAPPVIAGYYGNKPLIPIGYQVSYRPNYGTVTWSGDVTRKAAPFLSGDVADQFFLWAYLVDVVAAPTHANSVISPLGRGGLDAIYVTLPGTTDGSLGDLVPIVQLYQG